MARKNSSSNSASRVSTQPHLHQQAREIQEYGTVNHVLPLELEEPVRLEMTEQLNQLLADTMTLRDLYKKFHWQVAGPTFYQLHLLFDEHFGEQVELVDGIAERIQLLGGVSAEFAKRGASVASKQRLSKENTHTSLGPPKQRTIPTRWPAIRFLFRTEASHCKLCTANVKPKH